MQYLVRVSFDFDPTGMRYEAGEVVQLKGWKKAQIASALHKGLIEEVGEQEVGEWQKDKS